MATRAERFRAEAQVERSAAKAKTKRRTPKKATKRPDKPHNLGERAGRQAVTSYEASEGRPSRKSTRGSAHHMRASSALERTTKAGQAKPESRAQRARTRSVKVRGKKV